MKLLLAPFLLVAASILAGAYGAFHDQISYAVAPDYFHEFKFQQFVIPLEFHNRLGASWVGWNASWWMGSLVGVPILLICAFANGVGAFVRTYLLSAVIVLLVTLGIGLVALAVSFVTISADNLPSWSNGAELNDPVAFARAGTMHNFSYLGALLGMLAGFVVSIRAVIKSRVPTLNG